MVHLNGSDATVLSGDWLAVFAVIFRIYVTKSVHIWRLQSTTEKAATKCLDDSKQAALLLL
jgi:hypothetical protein